MLAANKKRAGGFTLVELLVAGALTVILGLILVSIFSSVGTAYQSTESRASSYRDARAALQIFSRELTGLAYVSPKPVASGSNASASPTPAPSPSPAPASSTLPPAVQLGIAGETAQTGTDNVETYASLGFLTKVPLQAQPSGTAQASGAPQTSGATQPSGANGNAAGANGSDVCLVGYFTASDPVTHVTSLYRALIPSTTTFTRLSTPGLTSYFTKDDVQATAPYTEVVADNVVDFKVSFMDANMQPLKLADVTSAEAQGKPVAVYLQITISVIGVQSASVYFDPTTSDAARQSLKTKDQRTFNLRLKFDQNV